MSGIVGWISWEADLTREGARLEAMGATLKNRGPDGQGIWLSPHAALGHRRLGGDGTGPTQPLVRHWGGETLALVWDGQLYNGAELQSELAARGHPLPDPSDGELILAAYAQWGAQGLSRLNGVFACAIWSARRERLFLARDPLGVKPLFYAARPGAFLFASELKALLAHPAVEPALDREGLAEVLVLGPARTPGHGIFRGVAELRPGAWLEAGRDGLKSGTYWRLESRPHPHDLATTLDHVRALLEDAVTRQVPREAPIASLLSGGLDSSAVSALAARHRQRRGGPLLTFSLEHAGNETHFQPDEFQPAADGPWARRVAAFLGGEHREVHLEPADLVAALPAAAEARDLPGMADVDASLYLFAQRIRTAAPVALSGEGADEVFGGYPWFWRPQDLEASTFPWVRRLPARLALLAPEVVAELQPHAYLERRYREALEEVPRLAGETPDEARARERLYLTLTRWLPVLLDRADRMSAAAGLELRLPFLDPRLVGYVWNVPWALKALDGVPKGLLRRALAGLLPPEVLERRKSPFPKTHHPAYLAAVRGWLLEILADRSSPLLGLVDRRHLVRLLQKEAPDLDVPFFGQLMRLPQLLAYLIQLDHWLRRYRVQLP